MSIGEDLAAFLAAQPALTGLTIAQNSIPQDDELPAIWFRRSTSNDDDTTLEANVTEDAQFSESFDLEAISFDLDEAEDIATVLKGLNKTRGIFGSGTIQGLFADDASDTYKPVNISDDDGKHVSTLDFELVGYEGP